jgi:hypothetical protein
VGEEDLRGSGIGHGVDEDEPRTEESGDVVGGHHGQVCVCAQIRGAEDEEGGLHEM